MNREQHLDAVISYANRLRGTSPLDGPKARSALSRWIRYGHAAKHQVSTGDVLTAAQLRIGDVCAVDGGSAWIVTMIGVETDDTVEVTTPDGTRKIVTADRIVVIERTLEMS